MSFSLPRNNNIPIKKKVEFASNPRVSSNVQALKNLNNVNLETLTLNNTTIAVSGEKLNTLNTTSGVALASKALVLDSNKNITDINDIVCDELYVAGQQITGEYAVDNSSLNNLSFINDITLGEAKESKILTTDANKNIYNINSTSIDKLNLGTNNIKNKINFNEMVPYNRIQNILQYFVRPVFIESIVTTITSFHWNPINRLLLTNSRCYLEDNNWKTNNTTIQNVIGQISYSNTLNMYIAGLLAPTSAASNLVSGVYYSYNGLSWSLTTIPTLGSGSTGNGTWTFSHWSPELNMFFIGNTNSSVTYKILYSTNGINWSIGYTGSTQIVRYFYWDSNLNGLVCFTNTNILISYNGTLWSIYRASYNGSSNFLNIVYSKDLDLFIGNTSTSNVLYNSLANVYNNVTFSTYSTSNVNAISYINDLNIIMLLGSSTISVNYTRNGINWTTINLPSVLSNTFNTAFYVAELETLFFGFNNTPGPLGSCYYPLKNVNLSYINNNTITKYKNDPITSWYIENPANNNQLTSSVYSGDLNLFVIVSRSGTGNRVMTSPDGINWTSRTSASDNNWTSICWSSELNLFVAVADSGSDNRVMTSPDGITWTSRTSVSNNNWTSVCWSPELNLFVAVANSGSGNRVMTSPDGLTWTSRTSSSDSNWTSICWSSYLNLFVAVATIGSNLIMTSSNGITWTNRTAPNNNELTSVCWANSLGLLVAVASSGTGNRIITSEDGINWISRTSPADNNWKAITFSDELDLLVAVSTNSIMKSNNGIDWITMDTNNSAWDSICWAPDLGIFLITSPNNIQISNVCIIGTQNSLILNKSNLITTNTASNIRNLRIGSNTGTNLVNITSTSNNESLRLNYNNSNSVDIDYNHPDLNITTNGTDKIVNIVNSNNSTTGLAFNSTLLNNSQLSKLSVTPGVASANKVAIVDSSRNISNINNISAHTIYVNNKPIFNNTDNNNAVLQDITPGIATTNKLLITDSSRNVSNLNQISSNNLTINDFNINSTKYDISKINNILSKGINYANNINSLNIKDIVYSPELNLYVVCGLTNIVYISSDLNNWTAIKTPGSLYSLIWVSTLNLFVGVGKISVIGLTIYNKVMISSDGINWSITGGTINSYDSNGLSICWSPQLNLLVISVTSNSTTSSILSSSNAITWTSRYSSSGKSWQSICWSPELSLFVAVNGVPNDNNNVLTSPDGITWTLRSTPASTPATFWTSVCWSSSLSLFVAVGNASNNRIMTSPNGITWTYRTAPALNNWNDVIWISELSQFVACASSGTNNRIMTSSNGTTWNLVNTSGANINYQTILYVNSQYILGGGNSSHPYDNNNIAISSNLSSFTLLDTNYTGFSDIIWINSLNTYIGISAISSTSTYYNRPIIMSSNGINWTYYTTNIYQVFTGNLSSIVWASSLSLFFISTTTGQIFRSSNGTTWTQSMTPSPALSGYTKIIWASSINRLVCIGSGGGNGTSRIIYSNDGITWTYSSSYTFPTTALSDIAWSNTLVLFVAIFNNNNTNSILTSTDGINWTNRTANTTGLTLNKILWIDYLNMFFIGGNQYHLYSTDGITWTVIRPQLFDNSYFNITSKLEWINNLNVLVTIATNSISNESLLYYSYDLITWYYVSINISSSNHRIISYSSQLKQFILSTNASNITSTPFIIYNLDLQNEYKSINVSRVKKNNNVNINAINRSVDNWILPTNTYNNNLTSICYSPGLKLFVAIANSGTGNRVVTSPDCITWTSRTSPADNSWNSICWSAELSLFVAVSSTGTGNRVMTSSNGTTWTIRSSAADNNWTSVCWSSELRIFIAVANSGTNNRIMTSSNGINWASIIFNYNNNLTSVCWSSELGLFVAVANTGSGNRVITSSDGITWSVQTSATDNDWTSICWSPELSLFVAVSNTGTNNRIMISQDGITWLAQTSAADNNWSSVCWSNELGIFLAVANSGTNNRIMTSSNGIDWITRTSLTDNNWSSVIWCADYGIFVAVANTGTNNRIMHSTMIIPSLYSIIQCIDDIKYGINVDQNTQNVGISMSNPTFLLQLSSNSAAKPSSNAWTISSDERLKENIQNANKDKCYNIVKNLPLKYYKWKDDIYPETLDRHKLGWIAQDVENIIPDSIITNEANGISDFKSLNSDQIITNMHGAMYKLIEIYEEQKNKISSLQNDINNMNTFLNSLN